jgi:hypothetical protein
VTILKKKKMYAGFAGTRKVFTKSNKTTVLLRSSNYLLYMIVVTPDDGHHEGPKHIVKSMQ